jgi:hypothetical protein
MPLVRPMALRNARLWPYDGGAPINPPAGGGGGTGGGGGSGGGSGMLIGAASFGVNAADTTHFAELNASAGPWQVRRSYNSGDIPTTWAASAAGGDVGNWASIWSAKPDPIAMAAGTLDASTLAFLQSIPDTHTAWVTIWHEPDVKIKQQTAPWTPAQYIAAYQRFFSLVRQVGKPHVYTTLLFGAYVYLHPRAGATMAELWPGNDADGRPYVDVIGFDGYSETTAETGAGMWGGGRQFAQDHGVAWGIAEVGFTTNVVSGSAAATWLQNQADYAAGNGAGPHASAAFVSMFNSTVGGVELCPEAYPETVAQSAAISQQYFTPYTSWVL